MDTRIRELRKARGLKQSDLAEILPCNKNHVGNIERGEREPSAKILVALSDYFDVSIDYLLFRENIPHHDQMDAIKADEDRPENKETIHGNEES